MTYSVFWGGLLNATTARPFIVAGRWKRTFCARQTPSRGWTCIINKSINKVIIDKQKINLPERLGHKPEQVAARFDCPTEPSAVQPGCRSCAKTDLRWSAPVETFVRRNADDRQVACKLAKNKYHVVNRNKQENCKYLPGSSATFGFPSVFWARVDSSPNSSAE